MIAGILWGRVALRPAAVLPPWRAHQRTAAYQLRRLPRLLLIHLFLLKGKSENEKRGGKTAEHWPYKDHSALWQLHMPWIKPKTGSGFNLDENSLPERSKDLWMKTETPCWSSCLSSCLVCSSYQGQGRWKAAGAPRGVGLNLIKLIFILCAAHILQLLFFELTA